MPYSGADDSKLPENVKKLSAADRKRWVGVFNGTFNSCMGKEGSKKADCEQMAFATANKKLKVGDKSIDWRPLGGATTLDEAEQVREAQRQMGHLWELWDTTQSVVDNILSDPEVPVSEKSSKVAAVLKELRARLTPEALAEAAKSVDAVKFIDPGRAEVKGYACLWGDEVKTDLVGDFFTGETDFWSILPKNSFRRALVYNHAKDPTTAERPVIGAVKEFGEDEIGIWYRAQLDTAHRFYEAVAKLIDDGALRSSTDSVSQFVLREPRGGAKWIKRWPIVAVSLTTTPCEPRLLPMDYVKATLAEVGVDLELPEDRGGEEPRRKEQTKKLDLRLRMLEL